MPIAPAGWRWFGFPLGDDGEAVDVNGVVEEGLQAIDRSERTGDQEDFGPVPHWAHILKTAQGPDGTWPAAVNARTGEPIGTARTVTPATLMARLDALLDSSEYAACIALAAQSTSQGEPDGRDKTHR